MFSYKVVLRNIQHNGVSPDVKKLKKFIEEYQFGEVDKPPTKRSYSFDELSTIMSARSRYSI